MTMENNSDKADALSLRRHCKTCPNELHCCSRATTIVVLPDEAEMITARTNKPSLLVRDESGLFTVAKAPYRPCPFLTSDRLCGIYDIRPTDCKSWPLTLADHNSTKLLVDTACPASRLSLSADFVAAASERLFTVPSDMRADYIRLVHRDSLPLALYGETSTGAVTWRASL